MSDPGMPPLLLTIEAAAAALSVNPTTVRRMLAAGDLHPVRVRRAVRVSVADLNAYVARQMPAGNTDSDHPTPGPTPCPDHASATKTASTSAPTRRTGGRRRPTDAGGRLADLLAFDATKTPRGSRRGQ